MKIASWNVNSLRVRLPQVLDWLQTVQPDLLALQETKLVDDAFPVEAIRDAGYSPLYSGQKTYNGVSILSRLTEVPVDVITDLPGLNDPQRRVLGASYGELRFLNLYIPNGASVGSDKYTYKLEWLAKLAGHVRNELSRHRYFVVAGDFNIAPEDRDVHDPVAWEGSVLVSELEREALMRILDLGLVDLFRLFDQEGGRYSWWDYRAAAFRRNHGLRIDLILANEAMSHACTACTIDREPRRLERPSDHAPVVAEFTIPE